MRKSVLRKKQLEAAASKSNAADKAERRKLAHSTQNRVRGVAPPDRAPAKSKRYNHQSEKYKDRPDPTKAVFDAIKGGRVLGVNMK